MLSYKKQVAASPFFLRLISVLEATNSSSGSGSCGSRNDNGGGGGGVTARGRSEDGCSRGDGPDPEQAPQQPPAAPEASPDTRHDVAGKPGSGCEEKKNGATAKGASGSSDRIPGSPMTNGSCQEGQQPQLARRNGEGHPAPPLWRWRDCTELVAYGLGRFDSGAPAWPIPPLLILRALSEQVAISYLIWSRGGRWTALARSRARCGLQPLEWARLTALREVVRKSWCGSGRLVEAAAAAVGATAQPITAGAALHVVRHDWCPVPPSDHPMFASADVPFQLQTRKEPKTGLNCCTREIWVRGRACSH